MRRASWNILILLAGAAFVTDVAGGARTAFAQSRSAKSKEIEAKRKAAMESYDMLDFEAARKDLDEALAIASKAGLARDKITAKVHLALGIVYFAGLQREDEAAAAFGEAAAIDPSIEIDVAYRTDQMAAALAAAKKSPRRGGRGAGGGDDGGAGCDALEGVQHELVESAATDQPISISAKVGPSAGADQVALFYRQPGTPSFTRVAMTRGDGCSFHASIPAEAARGESVHYYVAAYKGKQLVDSRGSSGSPNIVELGGASVAGGDPADGENPLGDDASIDGGVSAPTGERTIFVGISGGTGAGYVTGTTEVAGSEVGCCFAPALLHVVPELGYYFSRRTTGSIAFRAGFAIGANVEGHATASPAVLAKLRHALAPSGEGLQISAAAGGGIIRNTIKVEDAAEGMDTDTTASGPFLLGAGVGYAATMAGPWRLLGELNALAAIPGGIKTIGTCPGAGCVRPHFGLQFDLALGLLMAF